MESTEASQPESSTPQKFDLGNILSTYDKKLLIELEQIRTSFRHSGNKGSEVESTVREFLEDHLPRNLSVGTGEIVDLTGSRSTQVDIVISNQDQPFRAPRNANGLYLIEGVAAVGEVKSVLTTSELQKSISAGARLKKLRNYSQTGDTRFTNPVDADRYYQCPPFFVIAFESDVADTTALKMLHDAPKVLSASDDGPALPPVDALVVLERSFMIELVEGSARSLLGPTGEPVQGWVHFHLTATLVELLSWLSVAMPNVNRFRPIILPYLASRSVIFSSYEQKTENADTSMGE